AAAARLYTSAGCAVAAPGSDSATRGAHADSDRGGAECVTLLGRRSAAPAPRLRGAGDESSAAECGCAPRGAGGCCGVGIGFAIVESAARVSCSSQPAGGRG